MRYKIEATNGINRQYKKLPAGTTIEKAKQIIDDLYDNDYLGLDYYLLDEDDNEINLD